VNLCDKPHPVGLLSKTQFQLSAIGNRLLGVVSAVDEGCPRGLGLASKEHRDAE
jgi:hypothetical protein